MKFYNFHLSTRITLSALVIVVLSSLMWVYLENSRLHEKYFIERESDINLALVTEEIRLQQVVNNMRQDGLFLADIPPVYGIIRATQNHDINRKVGDSIDKWKQRMRSIFLSYQTTNQEYYDISFIGVANKGRELVKVSASKGKVEAIPATALQSMANKDFFKSLSKQPSNKAQFMDFNAFPKSSVNRFNSLLVATPVYASGKLFGMILLKRDISNVIELAKLNFPSGIDTTIFDEHGLPIFSSGWEAAFGCASSCNFIANFPYFSKIIKSQTASYLPLREVAEKTGKLYLSAKRIHLSSEYPKKFITLAYSISETNATQQIPFIPTRHIVNIILFVLVCGTLMFFLLRRTFAPLETITAAAAKIVAGNTNIMLPEDYLGEIGNLSKAINNMLKGLLQAENKFQQELAESLPGIFYSIDRSGRILKWNCRLESVLHCNGEVISGKRLLDFFDSEDKLRMEAGIRHAFETGEMFVDARLLAKDGDPISYHFTGKRITLRGKSVLIGLGLDITECKKAEDELRVAAAAFETHDAILITDAHSNIVRVNQAFTDVTGYSQEEVLGKNPKLMSSGHHDKVFYTEMWQQLLHTGSWAGEIFDKRKNGQIYPKWLTISAVRNERLETTHYVAIFSDITVRKQAEDEIHNLAFYDSLTKLPNRRLFMDRFRAALTISVRRDDYGAVLFIDLDRFKTLNDTLGHDYGDLLLIDVAARIKSCVREMDTVARLGGDEFVVLIEGVSKSQEDTSHNIGLIAEEIRETLTQPYKLKHHVHHSSPSIGISLYRGNENTVDELIQQADMAMYQAKKSGRNALRFFDPVMQENVSSRASLENDLHIALSERQFYLYYQIQMSGDKPIGAEALLRWIHPIRGMVLPGEFIHIAEESTLILDIGYWVLESGCHQLAQWAMNPLTSSLTLSLNVSSKQFAQANFVEQIAHLLQKYKIDSTLLKLELTESQVLHNLLGMVKKMHQIKSLGVQLSMDDFGTGYSSLSYLKDLPLDQIKIDQSFVQGLTDSGSNAMLVQTIIDLAQNFNLNVIAEGVETEAQLTFLRHHNCFSYQGFLFSKAISIDAFEKFLIQKLALLT